MESAPDQACSGKRASPKNSHLQTYREQSCTVMVMDSRDSMKGRPGHMCSGRGSRSSRDGGPCEGYGGFRLPALVRAGRGSC